MRAGNSWLVACVLLVLGFVVSSQFLPQEQSAAANAAPKQPRELGAISWERDFPKGLARARKSGKPILLLFQEVPG